MFHKKNLITTCRANILTVVDTDITTVTLSQVNTEAAKHPKVPQFKPDGNGAVLAFHTNDGLYVLGAIRPNPALKDALKKDGKPYPSQILATTGGYAPDPEANLKVSIL